MVSRWEDLVRYFIVAYEAADAARVLQRRSVSIR